ncbi:bacterial proteasome activator family protein [Sanguibacter sp. 25GB23B1]|uniref:bacterial proteasome activator family protein n=1 Tax=unclassified Sanguibacter TaxID=2645534 RepID=UPI0032AF059C
MERTDSTPGPNDAPGASPAQSTEPVPPTEPVTPSEPVSTEVTTQDDDTSTHTVIEEPAKVMRIGEMIKRMLDEVRSAPLDEAARTRLAAIHERSLKELEGGLSEDLVAELHRITLPFTDDVVPSDAELRIAQAQLVGWLEGLFHGLQTALVAQHMASQAQLTHGRGPVQALPPGLSHDGQYL